MPQTPAPEVPEVDYPHLPGEEHDPLMESTLHAQWCTLLIQAVHHTLAGTGAMVTGNTPFVPGDGGPHTAPDLMVVAGMADRPFGRYEVGRDGPPPSACVEILSPSNTRSVIDRRVRRWIECGVGEVYLLDPDDETVERATLDGTSVVRHDAFGEFSPALNLSFVRVEGRLALCCPGGRAVRVDDDPYGWLLAEQHRADEAGSRADAEQARADAERARAEAAEARAEALEAEIRRLRGE